MSIDQDLDRIALQEKRLQFKTSIREWRGLWAAR